MAQMLSKSLPPQTRSEEAYRELRALIVEGEFRPGQWLRQRGLANKMKMSPTPVVEALRRLEQEGLIELTPQWGARVRTWSVDELAEAFEMRAVLEGLVARKCAVVLSDEQIHEFRMTAEKLDRESQQFCDPARAAQYGQGFVITEDWNYHIALANAAGMRMVAREIERLQLVKSTCRLLVVPAPPTGIPHAAVVDAIASRDPDQAERVARDAIRTSGGRTVARLRERFGDGPIFIEPPRPEAVEEDSV